MIHKIAIVPHVFDIALRSAEFAFQASLHSVRKVFIKMTARSERKINSPVESADISNALRPRITHTDCAAIEVVITKYVK